MQCGLVAFTVATIAGDPDPMLAPILGAPQPGCAKASAGEVFQPAGVEPHDHQVSFSMASLDCFEVKSWKVCFDYGKSHPDVTDVPNVN